MMEVNNDIDAVLNDASDDTTSVDKTVERLIKTPIDSLVPHVQHQFFHETLLSRLETILQQWLKTRDFNADDSKAFSNISHLLLSLSETLSSTLQNRKTLIGTINRCLNSISAFGDFIDRWDDQGLSNIVAFDELIQTYMRIESNALLESVFHCATSTPAQYSLPSVSAVPISPKDHFLYVTCPQYMLQCEGEGGRFGQQMMNLMLNMYAMTFDRLFDDTTDWIEQHFPILVVPLTLIAHHIASLESETKRRFVWVTTKILEKGHTESDWTSLFHSSLRILRHIARSQPEFLNDLRDHPSSLTSISATLQRFIAADHEDNKMSSAAYELLVFLIPEDDLPNTVDPKCIAEFFVHQLQRDLTDASRESIRETLESVKNVVHNSHVRDELLKHEILPMLVHYAEESFIEPAALEIIHSFLFTEEGKCELGKEDYEPFLEHLAQLENIGRTDIRDIVSGILWKFKGEEKFHNAKEYRQSTGNFGPQVAYSAVPGPPRATPFPESEEPTFHLMISYSWANQPLCRRIAERLLADGYRVWIDLNEMHGSIVERMAEGIENSNSILLCMSSNYKKSANCQAEAEYAFNRKRTIIPLAVEHKYKPDGWLGLIVGNRLYINFSKTESEEFEKAYRELIAQLERHGLRPKRDDGTNDNLTSPPPPFDEWNKTAGNATLTHKETLPPPPIVVSREYRDVKEIKLWKEKHVIEYLVDHNFDVLLPVFTGMNGQGLLEMYNVYERSPNKLYKILNMNHPTLNPGIFFKFISAFKTWLMNAEQATRF